jgi:hypothetical protein
MWVGPAFGDGLSRANGKRDLPIVDGLALVESLARLPSLLV